MVSKNVLKQYIDLKAEIEETRERIEKTKRQIQKIEEQGTVIDSVKGGDGGIQRFKIEGFASADYGRQRAILFSRIALLQTLENDVQCKINDVEEFIQQIDDSFMRRIISLRFVKGLSWEMVAADMGSGCSKDSVRMAFNRFMEKVS